ncbi:MAG: dockerin type I repeat-containing protein, partial [Clostridia bacterium]|nr:dockerin type I repeat-containing protein [Clostridia bacterium]
DGNISMTLEITPMRQTVATVSEEGTTLDGENSVAVSGAHPVDISSVTEVTVGIPNAMATAAGGAGSTVYVRHTHDGVTYEHPALICGNEADGFTATFENPVGYSEFTVTLQSTAAASFVQGGITYSYTSFGEAIAAALSKGACEITMYRMPYGEDVAMITENTIFTFRAAQGCEDQIDFDALYAEWLTTDDGIGRSSTPEQLAGHRFAYGEQIEYTPGDVNGDGKFTSKDISILKRVIAGTAAEGTYNELNADVNGDGKFTSKDISALKKIIAQG